MQALGTAVNEESRVYFTGGATAVLLGWRSSTIDVDLTMVPERDRIFRALAHLKDELHINVELASPADFIPVASGWEERSPFIAHEGRLFFHHFDPYAQALSKIERGHVQDLRDVQELISRGLVDPQRALAYFEQIEPLLYRYPAIDPARFRSAVEAVLRPAR